jgi:pyruvate ferredoxin oxidoreductase alpha subunit
MSRRTGIEVSIAAAEAVALANVDVVAAYPITPQTHIVEHLAELVSSGRLDAEYIPVESEHSAISSCLGASAAGARTFTASASQGLALMHEILFIASGLRLPMVMAVANRAVSPPINIWADHSDIMPQRDTGWVQLFAENGQDVYDLILQAFRLSEDERVLLPVMVNMDGFTLSHVIEPVSMLSTSEIGSFLPPVSFAQRLDIKNPRSIGTFGAQNVYTEVKQQQEDALVTAGEVLKEIWDDFSQQFGRRYNAVETYHLEGAEVVLVTMGAIAETARTAVDEMRSDGLKIGLAGIRLWRPFPCEELAAALEDVDTVAVVDRMMSPGAPGGPVGLELRSLFYERDKRPKIYNFIAGLGGREITRKTFKEVVKQSRSGNTQDRNYTLIDVRSS